MIKQMIYVKGKRYFFYRITEKKPNFQILRKEIPHTNVYWIKVYNLKQRKEGYAIYLDKKITWY